LLAERKIALLDKPRQLRVCLGLLERGFGLLE